MKLTLLLMLYPFIMLAQAQEPDAVLGANSSTSFGWFSLSAQKTKLGITNIGGNLTGGAANQVLRKVSGTNYDWAWVDLAGGGNMLSTNNLSDVANVATARTNLGLWNLDNTSDANKPVSTAQQTALNLKANLASAAFTGAVTSSSPSAGIGYVTGAGSTVTQATSKTTGVTLNNICGRITMNAAALAAGAEVAFTLTNSRIAATDVVVVSIQSVGTAGAYFVDIGAVAAGSCSITVGNVSAGSLSQAIVLNFVVIKSSIN